ncbi:MAG: trypsin-like serine protease [Elusimicrobiota bacterium]|jgi:hypothetical protein|nr:trypsin-like serine protease [Elusimicrobiota bacterium]
MKKTLLFLPAFIILAALPPAAAYAQSSIIYDSSYEINIIPGPPHKDGDGPVSRPMNKCQAVRLNKEWFLTAAHCVQNQCNSGCTLQARLLVGPGYEIDLQYYAASQLDDAIKIYNSQSVNKSNIAYDIALIKLSPERSQYIYIIGNLRMPYDVFMQSAEPDASAVAAAVNGAGFSKLLVLRTETAKIFNRQIVLPSIWGGARQLLTSHDTVFYSPKNQYIFTDNFGIRQGISGAGVFTASGELCGVVSATGVLRQSSGEGSINPINYTFLTVFNDDVLRFITRYAGNTASTTADINYFKVIPEDRRDFVFAVEASVT